MKAALYFLTVSLCTFAGAAPRITQISPSTGQIDGQPVAKDIDNDGDLDLAYLATEGSASLAPFSSTWLENLGGQKFSSPRSLGSYFRSNRRVTNSEALISPPGSDIINLIASVSNLRNNTTELYQKSPSASEWHLIQTFEFPTLVILPDSQNSNFPGFLSYDETTPGFATIWQFSSSGDAFPIGKLTIPESLNFQDPDPQNLQSADLDLDGDSDLILQSQSKTLLYERIESQRFSSEPVIIEVNDALVGDFNQDQLPDFIDRGQLLNVVINEGGFQFATPQTSGPNLSTHSASLVNFNGQPTLVAFVRAGSTFQQRTYQADPKLNFSLVATIDLPAINATAPLMADFDGDDRPETSLISRTTLFRSSLDFVDRVTIPGIPRAGSDFINIVSRVPEYDRVLMAWNTEQTPAQFVPANPDSPVMCHTPAVGDFNNDGVPDLVVGPDSNGNAWIMINDGHGGFHESRILNELIPPETNRETFHLQDFVPVDINGDGFLDLSFSLLEPQNSAFPSPSLSSAACAIALGNGQGGFEPPTFAPGVFDTITASFCGISSFDDWDNDGDLDATLPGAWRENVDGVLRDGAYPLIQNAPATDALGNPISLAAQHISDIDGDGLLDFFIPAVTATAVPFTNQGIPGISYFPYNYTAGVAFNNGFGGISEISDRSARLLVTDALGNPLVLPFIALDLDLDDRRELLIAQPEVDALGNPIVLGIERWQLDADNPRDFSLARAMTISAFSIPWSDELVDFNGDGELEYAANDQFVTPTVRGPLVSPKYNFRGDHLGFSSSPLATAAVADFDNDGDLDSLYARGFSGLYLVRNSLVDEDSPITNALVSAGFTPSNATPQADADGDGRSNALEFLQGTDPLVADLALSDFLKTNLSADGRRLTFHRPANAAEFALYYDLEISDDLENWSKIQPSETTIEPIDANSQKVSVEIPRSRARSYFRISATHDPRRP